MRDNEGFTIIDTQMNKFMNSVSDTSDSMSGSGFFVTGSCLLISAAALFATVYAIEAIFLLKTMANDPNDKSLLNVFGAWVLGIFVLPFALAISAVFLACAVSAAMIEGLIALKNRCFSADTKSVEQVSINSKSKELDGKVPEIGQTNGMEPEDLQVTKVQLLEEMEGYLTHDGYTQDKINELSSIRDSMLKKGFINKENDDNLLFCINEYIEKSEECQKYPVDEKWQAA